MFFLKAVFCRIFQAGFRVALPVLPYTEPEIVPSCAKLDAVLKQEKIKGALVVTDKGIVASGLVRHVERALENGGVPYVTYDETLPNPTVRNVEDALALYKAHGCNATTKEAVAFIKTKLYDDDFPISLDMISKLL